MRFPQSQDCSGMYFGKLNLFADNPLAVESTFAVHWPSPDGPPMVHWWCPYSPLMVTDYQWTIHTHGSNFHPYHPWAVNWTVHWWCLDGHGHPVMVSGLFEQSKGYPREDINQWSLSIGQCLVFLHKQLYFVPPPFTSQWFLHVSTWTRTMHCFKCRQKYKICILNSIS